MSIQLKSHKAHQIQERLKLKQLALKKSLQEFKNSASQIKTTVFEIKKQPFSLLFPKAIEITNQHVIDSRAKVRRHPFSLIFTAVSLGCLTRLLLSKNKKIAKQNLGTSFSNSMNSLLDKVSRTSFANRIWSKVKVLGEEALDEALGIKDTNTRFHELEKLTIYRDEDQNKERYDNGDARI